jgi:hypothetical protein
VDSGKLGLTHPEFGDIVAGAFTPVLAKHSKSFSLIDCISVGVDRMQRNFEPMRKQVEMWQRSELTDVTAKVVIYEAFVEGRTRSSETSCPHRPRSLLRADEVRGIPVADHLESLQCVYVGIQGARSHHCDRLTRTIRSRSKLDSYQSQGMLPTPTNALT